MVRVKAIKNANFGYQKIFGEEEFFAAGVLHIPVKAEKASKNSRDNAYVGGYRPARQGPALTTATSGFPRFQGMRKSIHPSAPVHHCGRRSIHDPQRFVSLSDLE